MKKKQKNVLKNFKLQISQKLSQLPAYKPIGEMLRDTAALLVNFQRALDFPQVAALQDPRIRYIGGITLLDVEAAAAGQQPNEAFEKIK
jgi:hypothetical protein